MSLEQSNEENILTRVAEDSGLAVVVVDEADREISVANNNSICRLLYPSAEFGPRCGEYCGKAYEIAVGLDGAFDYECHAGLRCRAVPFHQGARQLVAIVGRAFVKAENYRKATDRAINGDWRSFRPTEFFDNVLLTSSVENIENAAARIEAASDRVETDILELDSPMLTAVAAGEPCATEKTEASPVDEITTLIDKFNREVEQAQVAASKPPISRERSADVAAWRSLFGSLIKLEYKRACGSVLRFLAERYAILSLIFFERRDNQLAIVTATGEFADKPVRIAIPADSRRLLEVAREETALVFRPRGLAGADPGAKLNVFPIVVGGETRGAVAAAGLIDDDTKRRISRFCKSLGPELEILRLRNVVSERDWLSKAVRRFNESLKRIDAEDFWMHLTQISAELLQAERASLLVRNDRVERLQAKAAIGAHVNLYSENEIGNRVARIVLDTGDPTLVTDINRVGIKSAPEEWRYKTPSFISYPILIGDRRLAVMNFADKAGGSVFTDRDLEILQAIAPQIAVAIDRTALKDKAGEFEQLSITDALTGLLNRRYLEKRLAEEIERSKRHRFPVSLMMLDVDEFKSYNDTFGHPAGDVALKMVAGVLKETLRAADVAARYGGEEFAILLPQTTSSEAAVIAERIRWGVERTEFPKRRVTVSIGIASCSADIDSADDLLTAADSALYEAKNHGRNKVQIYESFGKSLNNKIH